MKVSLQKTHSNFFTDQCQILRLILWALQFESKTGKVCINLSIFHGIGNCSATASHSLLEKLFLQTAISLLMKQDHYYGVWTTCSVKFFFLMKEPLTSLVECSLLLVSFDCSAAINRKKMAEEKKILDNKQKEFFISNQFVHNKETVSIRSLLCQLIHL